MSYARFWDHVSKNCEWISNISKLEFLYVLWRGLLEIYRTIQTKPYLCDVELDLSYMMEVEEYLYLFGMTL